MKIQTTVSPPDGKVQKKTGVSQKTCLYQHQFQSFRRKSLDIVICSFYRTLFFQWQRNFRAMKGLWLIALIGCFITSIYAQRQKDTSIFLKFDLITSKPTANLGSVKINLPQGNSSSIADALSQYSALFVKYYGPNSLATTSMRGMGAHHTAVLWNGINLQSSMNSLIDFNLLPCFFIDQAMIETGANASSSANGAIAGAIYLNNRIERKKTIFAEIQRASFNTGSYALGYNYFYKKWSFRTRAMYKNADNNFEYANYFLPGKPMQRLAHSKMEQYGLMQEINFKLSEKHQFYLNIWHQKNFRQLPPPMGASPQNEKQQDFNTRVVLQHDLHINSRNTMVNKLACLDEQINYFNDLILPAYSHAKTYIAESELKTKLHKKLDFSTSLNYTYQTASTDGYTEGKQRHLWSLWTRLEWRSIGEKFKASLANRQLIYNAHMAPSSPDLGFEYKLSSAIKLKGNVAYSFRLPSFNDLYWSQGGNRNLKPEKGKKAELSVEFNHSDFKFSATGFYHQVNNWILWLPDASTNIWRATNARQVESRGVEMATEYNMTIYKHHAIKIFGRYQVVQSINTRVYAEDLTALHKQLFYTPVQTGFAQLRYSFKQLQFNFGAVYTGSRFTTSDNDVNYQLPAFVTLNTGLTYQFKWAKQNQSSLSFQINNLGNTTYQVIENRPMPLRNYQITLKININYEKH